MIGIFMGHVMSQEIQKYIYWFQILVVKFLKIEISNYI